MSKKQTELKPLFMTLQREPFKQILNGTKREEYRETKEYWRKKLEGREYKSIIFQNGYSPNSPRIEIEYQGFYIKTFAPEFFKGKKQKYYALRLGKILNTKNLKP